MWASDKGTLHLHEVKENFEVEPVSCCGLAQSNTSVLTTDMCLMVHDKECKLCKIIGGLDDGNDEGHGDQPAGEHVLESDENSEGE